eukprot:5697851-Amphidinium_carterae.1
MVLLGGSHSLRIQRQFWRTYTRQGRDPQVQPFKLSIVQDWHPQLLRKSNNATETPHYLDRKLHQDVGKLYLCHILPRFPRKPPQTLSARHHRLSNHCFLFCAVGGLLSHSSDTNSQ